MSQHDGPGSNWTLLTGHGHVLVEIARNPGARIRDIASVVGLTERTVQVIVTNLEAAGYLTRARAGRRTLYTVNPDSPFRHAAQDGHRVGPFLALLSAAGDTATVTEHGDGSRSGRPGARPAARGACR
ncbi:MAG: helix-turn-helix transcriptional regulator [Trebonia sp.]